MEDTYGNNKHFMALEIPHHKKYTSEIYLPSFLERNS